MKKLVLVLTTALLFCFVSCGTTKLYNWSNYDDTSYKYLKEPNEKTLTELLKTYDYIMKNQSNTLRQTVPPGVCADYGYFLMQSGKKSEGLDLLAKEVELYPESKIFIDSIKEMVK